MKNQNNKFLEFVREHAIDVDISYRGGSLKVDATELFPSLGERAIVGAYQNYLGGGMAGAIVGAAMFMPQDLSAKEQRIFHRVLDACKAYFFELNNGGGDEYMQSEYGTLEFNQNLPVSAY